MKASEQICTCLAHVLRLMIDLELRSLRAALDDLETEVNRNDTH